MTEYKLHVRYYETDKMGITHHSNYIRWMEEARVDFLEKIGLPFRDIEAIGLVSPVVGISVEYKAPTTFDEEVTVYVAISEYDGVKLNVSYLIKRPDGKIAAKGTSKHCFLKDGRVCSLKKINEEMHQKLLDAAHEHTSESM